MEQINTEALKKKILDLAIRGKLVEQDPNDEPASVLLEKIRAEKEELIQQKKIKRNKNESYIFKGDDGLYYEKFQDGTVKSIQDEIPFEVPEGWEWVRFSNVYQLISGQDLSSQKYGINGDIPYITGASNFIKGEIYTDRFTNFPKSIAYKNDLLITVKGTVGKMATLKYDRVHIARQVMAIRSSKTNLEYIKIFLHRNLQEIQNKANSMIPGISRDILLNLLIPMPPTEEIKRILKKYQLIFNQIDLIENDQLKLFSMQNKIKDKTLTLAMQGKLIPQDPNDEPASVLLEKIKEEKEKLIKEGKIKRNKKESTIIRRGESYYELLDGKEKDITNEIPFEIPEKWMWIRLRDIAKEIKAGGDRPTEVSKIKNEIYQYPIYSNGSKNKGLYGYSKRAIIKESAITISARGTIGYSEIRQPNFTPIVRLICILLNTKFIDIKYINYVFNLLISPQEGTSIPQLTVPNIREKLIPLPPNKEQMKISIILDKLKEV